MESPVGYRMAWKTPPVSEPPGPLFPDDPHIPPVLWADRTPAASGPTGIRENSQATPAAAKPRPHDPGGTRSVTRTGGRRVRERPPPRGRSRSLSKGPESGTLPGASETRR